MKMRKKPLRVVHIGTADKVGGAARAQWRMHESLLATGIDSRILCGFKSAEDDRVARVPMMNTLPGKVIRRIAHRIEQATGMEYRLLPWSGQFLNHPWIMQADIIHLHNLHGGFFPIGLLPKLAKIAPLVWSAHDLWPTTGHCYFPQMTDCKCWTGESSCNNLRQDDWYPLSRNTSQKLWRNKRDLVAASSPTFIAQSSFTQSWLRSAPITQRQTISHIPYALDTHVFSRTNKAEARKLMGVPDDRPIVMFSAVSLSQPRKGGASVMQALAFVADRLPNGVTLLMVGGAELPAFQSDRVRMIILGQIDDDVKLALAYSTADVFVGASVVETFGQVFSEAASCGTPGVAFDTTGVSDAIRHNQTGLLAPQGNVNLLAKSIEQLLKNKDQRHAMAKHGREVCENEYAYPVVAPQLIALYESALSQS